MPLTTFAGHPLHPQLVEFPLGLLPFSFAMDLMHLTTRDPSYADAAYYSMAGGMIGGLAAGTAGFADYLTIPDNTHSKKTANVHAALNLGILGLYGLNLFLRKGRHRSPGVAPRLLSALGAVGLIASSWYGGELVYELGMRVKPLMDGEEKFPELKLPGDSRIEQAFKDLEKKVTTPDGLR
jgi:uncharacterized membrane protein